MEWFLENISKDEELNDTDVLLDESYQIMDSRAGMTKQNRLFTYFAVQTRKLGVDLYLPTHSIENIDIRIRRATDIRGTCKTYTTFCPKCKCKKCKGAGTLNGRPCDECDGNGGTGLVNGEPCLECLGYGKLCLTRVFALDKRAHRRYTVDITPPDYRYSNFYFRFFNTKERIPLAARLLTGIDTSVVGYGT